LAFRRFLERKKFVNLVSKANCLRAILAVGLVMGVAGRSFATLFTPGDLVVSTYGTVNGLSQGAPTPISLIEFAVTGGSAVLTDTLPTADGVGGASNLGVVGQYGSQSEGNIQLSGNGQYLTIAGYSATAAGHGINASTNTANETSFTIGTPFEASTVSLAQSTDTNVPRLAVLVDGNGNVNSSTEMNDVYNTNNPRSVYSASGSTFYISGQGDGNNSDQGIFNGPVGLNTVNTASTPTGIFNSTNTRFVTALGGNLYYSADTSSGSFTGIWKFSGLPTGAATATQITPANNGLSGSNKVFYSPDGFYFANSTTLYVADTGLPKAGSKGDGGIQKWVFNGSSWALQYTLDPAGQDGFVAITGQVVGSGPGATVDLYAVSSTVNDDDPDDLYGIADTLSATSGTGENFSLLESAPGNGGLQFKGVAFAPGVVPEPASVGILCMGGVALMGRRRARKA
jgi:hypothetical protein